MTMGRNNGECLEETIRMKKKEICELFADEGEWEETCR